MTATPAPPRFVLSPNDVLHRVDAVATPQRAGLTGCGKVYSVAEPAPGRGLWIHLANPPGGVRRCGMGRCGQDDEQESEG